MITQNGLARRNIEKTRIGKIYPEREKSTQNGLGFTQNGPKSTQNGRKSTQNGKNAPVFDKYFHRIRFHAFLLLIFSSLRRVGGRGVPAPRAS